MLVVKRSGSRDPFSREKLRGGVSRACAKTSVSAEQIDEIVDSVENELSANGKREVPAATVGEMVLKRLKGVDEVAYVRFASVYRQFQSVEDFVEELGNLASSS